jgi:hypothetical protein
VDDVIDVATQTDMDGIDVGVQTDILLYQQVQLLNLLNSYRAVKSSSALRESRNPAGIDRKSCSVDRMADFRGSMKRAGCYETAQPT